MLENLTDRLSRVVKTMRGEARLTERNTADMLREIRLALLEADVALPVVKSLLEQVKFKALGEEVVGSLSPGQALVGVAGPQPLQYWHRAIAGVSLRPRCTAADEQLYSGLATPTVLCWAAGVFHRCGRVDSQQHDLHGTCGAVDDGSCGNQVWAKRRGGIRRCCHRRFCYFLHSDA